jgi:hypothetical protein
LAVLSIVSVGCAVIAILTTGCLVIVCRSVNIRIGSRLAVKRANSLKQIAF